MAYLRFVVSSIDPDSGRRMGIFHVVREFLRTGNPSRHEREILDAFGVWFNEALEQPTRFSRSRRPRAKAVAICWFKDSAKEHMARLHTVASILSEHGIQIDVITTERPGYIVYEDEWQVTAQPFDETIA
jgi:hypothetical protein